MRRGFVFGLGLLFLVGCGRSKTPLVPTLEPQEVITILFESPTPLPPTPTPLVSSVSAVSNLRAEPSTEAEIITTVDSQAAILILAQHSYADQLWYRVRVNDYLGWMSASLFSLPAEQQASLPWEQAMLIPSPTVQPTNRPYATNRPFPTTRPSSAKPPATSRPIATSKPQATSRPSSAKPPATSRPSSSKPPTSNKPRR